MGQMVRSCFQHAELELVILAERDNTQRRYSQQRRNVGLVLVAAPVPVLTLTSLHQPRG